MAVQERRRLTTLAREVGPVTPTLCEGWTVRDLVAHLVVREGWPVQRKARQSEEDFGELVDRLRRGLQLEDGHASFDGIEPQGRSEGHSWYQVSLHEGRNREVRRLFEAAGLPPGVRRRQHPAL